MKLRSLGTKAQPLGSYRRFIGLIGALWGLYRGYIGVIEGLCRVIGVTEG